MARLNDISNAALRGAVGNYNMTKGVLAINAASAATIKSTNAYTYAVNGILYSKAALSAQVITNMTGPVQASTTTYVQPISTTVYYVVCLDAAGTVSIVQGSYATQALGGGAIGDGSIPDVASTVTPIGIFKVATNASATFTAGTTALDAAGVTVTYYDVAGPLPVGSV